MYNDRTRPQDAVAQVGGSVLIPEGAGVLPAFGSVNAVEGLPGPCGVLGFGHEQPLGGGAEVEVKPAAVIGNGRRPASPAVGLHLAVLGGDVQTVIGSADDFPVDQVLGVEDGNSHIVEFRTDHIKVPAHPDDIGVGVVGVQDRVAVVSVAQVAPLV